MRVHYTYLFGLVFLFSSDKYIEAELLDHVAVLFSILWEISTLFSIVTTPISTHTRVPFSPHPRQHLSFLVFLVIVILQGDRYITVVFICISLIIRCWEPFHVSAGQLYAFFRNCPFRSSAHFSITLFVFCYWVTWILHIYLVLSPYLIYDLQIFSPIWYAAFSFCWWFPLLCGNILVWRSLIC